MKLPIILSDGIGDSLLLLSFVPHHFLSRFGIRFNVFYNSPTDSNKQYILAKKVIKDLVDSIPHFYFQETMPTNLEKKIFQVMIRTLRRRVIYEASSAPKSIYASLWLQCQRLLGIKSLYKTTIKFNLNKKITNKQPDVIRVLIQTHMDTDFANFKNYGAGNWLETIQLLRSKNAGHLVEFWILEYNSEAVAYLNKNDPDLYVLNEICTSFPEIIASFAFFDVLVAVDSWSKYVAKWYEVNSIILVPSQFGKGHTNNWSPTWLLAWFFNGLYGDKNFDLIGLELNNGIPEYTLDSLTDLSPVLLAGKAQNRILNIWAKNKRDNNINQLRV